MAALPILSLLTIATTAFEAIIGGLVKLFEFASPDQRVRIIELIVVTLEWWQENVWAKLGDFLDGPD